MEPSPGGALAERRPNIPLDELNLLVQQCPDRSPASLDQASEIDPWLHQTTEGVRDIGQGHPMLNCRLTGVARLRADVHRRPPAVRGQHEVTNDGPQAERRPAQLTIDQPGERDIVLQRADLTRDETRSKCSSSQTSRSLRRCRADVQW